jgi:hypothetical protein
MNAVASPFVLIACLALAWTGSCNGAAAAVLPSAQGSRSGLCVGESGDDGACETIPHLGVPGPSAIFVGIINCLTACFCSSVAVGPGVAVLGFYYSSSL